MPAVPLTSLLTPALAHGYAIAGLVVLGWEDALAYSRAAQAVNQGVALQIGPGSRRHTPLAIQAAMLGYLAAQSDIPLVLHLDHADHPDVCFAAMDLGFTSVMFDGSHLPLADNIRLSQQVVERSRAYQVSVEGEVGVVGYADGTKSQVTAAREAEIYVRETGVDALAISVGNVHLQTTDNAVINWQALAAIEGVTDVPLVRDAQD